MKMKKITLSIAGVLAAIAFAPEASAIPAFARQTGMACSACHFQHFPVLNAFGRSFKSSGYTLMGTQSQVEGENLALPSNLNAAIFINAQYNKTNGASAGNTATNKTTNNGQLQIPNAMSLFMGGRIAENVGFITEVGLVAPAGVAAFKMPFMFDVGSAKVGAVAFTTDSLGVAHSFELMNTGAVAVHAFNQADIAAMSAQAYIGTTGGAALANPVNALGAAGAATSTASGVAFVASSDIGFINVAKFSPSHIAGGANGAPTSNYVRAAWLGDVKGWDAGIGFQVWSGVSSLAPVATNGVAAFNGGPVNTKATAIDAQLLGEVGGMPLTIVASYAKAPKSDVGAGVSAVAGNSTKLFNLFNTSETGDRTSFNVAAELGIIPHKATLQLAIRQAKTGANIVGNASTTSNASDNAIMLGATYELAQNLKFVLTESMYRGDTYNAAAQTAGIAAGTWTGNKATWLQLESAF